MQQEQQQTSQILFLYFDSKLYTVNDATNKEIELIVDVNNYKKNF